MNIINSPANQKIKDLVRLRKAADRKEKGVIIIDGWRESEAAAVAGWEMQEIFFSPDLPQGPAALKLAQAHGLDDDSINQLSLIAFEKAGYKENPDGCLSVFAAREQGLENFSPSANPFLVILESVEKPGNLGAIIRTARAAGVEAIIINDQQTDIFNPNVIRASEGLIFSLPIIIASTKETQEWLEKHQIASLAAVTSAKKIYSQEDLSGPLALVFGSEADGLSQAWIKQASKKVRIPMLSGIDSLNVSVSAAIMIYEARRQRGGLV